MEVLASTPQRHTSHHLVAAVITTDTLTHASEVRHKIPLRRFLLYFTFLLNNEKLEQKSLMKARLHYVYISNDDSNNV